MRIRSSSATASVTVSREGSVEPVPGIENGKNNCSCNNIREESEVGSYTASNASSLVCFVLFYFVFLFCFCFCCVWLYFVVRQNCKQIYKIRVITCCQTNKQQNKQNKHRIPLGYLFTKTYERRCIKKE